MAAAPEQWLPGSDFSPLRGSKPAREPVVLLEGNYDRGIEW